MRKIIRYGPLILLLLAPRVADAQQAVTSYPAPWSQVGNTVSLAVTNSTGNVKLGWASVTPAPTPPPPALRVCNTGTVAASIAVGGSSITVVATTGIPVSAGACSLIALNGATYVAAITAASTTTITAQTGTGTPYAGGPGDSGGTGVYMATNASNSTSAALQALATNAGAAGLSLGGALTAAIINSTNYQIAGNAVLDATVGYTDLYDSSQRLAIALGGMSDQNNYYRNLQHRFQPAGGGSTYAVIGNGVQIGVPTGGDEGTGTINAAGAIYDNGTAPTGTAGSGYVRATSPTVVTPILTGYAIGSLPSGTIGMLAYVTNQVTACPALGIAPTAGGTIKCRVWYNGSAWVGD